MTVKNGVCSPTKNKVDGRFKTKSLNEIFRNYYKGYCEKYKGHISAEQYKVINALLTCRTVDLGGHLYKCDSCEKHHIVYNSCKNRHCPTCQGLKSAEWLLKRSTELLPLQYFHIVFTVPDELNPLFLQNKKELYSLLFKITLPISRNSMLRNTRKLTVITVLRG